MRTTATLDDDVFEAAQAQAHASGKKLDEVFSQSARRGLGASAQSNKKSRLPVFKVRPDARSSPAAARKRCSMRTPRESRVTRNQRPAGAGKDLTLPKSLYQLKSPRPGIFLRLACWGGWVVKALVEGGCAVRSPAEFMWI